MRFADAVHFNWEWLDRGDFGATSYHAFSEKSMRASMATGTRRGEKRLARPHRIRVCLRDDASGATPIHLPKRRMWPMGLALFAFFAMFAAIWWTQVSRISFNAMHGMFDLVLNLFTLFWVMGWSVAVVILGLLALLFLFYGEAVRIVGDRLVTVSKLGPLKIFSEYLLKDIRRLRSVNSGSAEMVSVRFDYAEGNRGLGDAMPRREAELLIAAIRAALPKTLRDDCAQVAPDPEVSEPPTSGAPAADKPLVSAAPAPLHWCSPLALVAANLVPLAGVLFLGWGLGTVMVLFWAESAVIGFYTLIKMGVVGKVAVLFAGPFFVGHFGAFMSIHFLFIQGLFLNAGMKPSEEPPALQALAALFFPLWPALLALFASHGISFVLYFLLRREYRGQTVSGLMSAPYRRIIVMQLAIIFGGFMAMLLKTPLPALVLLIVLKIIADLYAHRREHALNRMSARGG